MHVGERAPPREVRHVSDDVHLEQGAAVVNKLLEHARRGNGGQFAAGELEEAVAVVDEGEGVGGLAAVCEERLGDWREERRGGGGVRGEPGDWMEGSREVKRAGGRRQKGGWRRGGKSLI